MFKEMLRTQWRWTRGMLLLATVLGVTLPLASLRYAGGNFTAAGFVARMQEFGAAYAAMAAGVGLSLAVMSWGHDHRGRHVYALTLPVTRWRYALMRYSGGALLMALPTAGVLAGTIAVAASGAIPLGLHAYPIALTLRFAFAALVAYSIFFAISASTGKAAGMVLGAIGSVFLAHYVLDIAGLDLDVLGNAANVLFNSPGLLSVFSGRWMLVDV